MIKIIRESIFNRIMLASFLIIMLFNIFSLLSMYDWVSTATNSLMTFISVPIAVIIAVYPKFRATSKDDRFEALQEDEKDKSFVGLIDYNDIKQNRSKLLKRTQHRENIIKNIEDLFVCKESKVKGLVLTGESGAGKSILLRFILDELVEKEYNAHIVNTYNDSGEFPKPNKNKKNVFIFDQFERALDFSTIEHWIDMYKGEFDNCVFVFSFPQKFLTGIYNKILQRNKDFYLKCYVLYLNEEDEKDYLKKITAITGLEDVKILEMWNNKSFYENENFTDQRTTNLACLLERELYNVKRGNSPLIEMEFLGEMVEQSIGSETIITDSNFVECYFNEWVEKFDKKETAYAILTLFTRFDSYSLEDIKNVTFEAGREFDQKLNGKILYLLKKNSFLTQKFGGKKVDTNSSNCTFMPRHEYVSLAIQKYLATKEIPLGVKCFIEHYRINSKKKYYLDKIKKRYDDYTKKHILLNIFLCLILTIVLVLNCIWTFSTTESIDLIYHRIFITAVSFPSIFYIYNYCDKIMSVNGYIGSLLSGCAGFSIIVASYLFPEWWGILLGMEIIIFSFCIIISMPRNITKEAKESMMKDFIIFLFIGVTIVALGVIFLCFFSSVKEISWQYNTLKYSYYVLFMIYSLMSDVNHIKYSYICSKIGYLNAFVV